MLKKRYTVLTVDIVVMLFSGLLYTWSVFVTPLEADFDWTRSQTSLTFTLCSLVTTIAAFLSATLAKKIGPHRVMRLAALIALAGFGLTSRITALWQLYLCFGIIGAFAIGSTYNQILGTIVRWFGDRSSLVTGIMLMCYGMGSMILSPVNSLLIQAVGWRNTFMILAVTGFVLMMGGSFFIRYPNETEEEALASLRAKASSKNTAGSGLSPDTDRGNLSGQPANQSQPKELNFTFIDMIKTPAFWFMALWNLSVAAIGLTMSSHASPIAQTIGLGATAAAFYAGIVSLCNGVGRVILGAVFDRIGYKKTMMLVSFISISAGLLLILSYKTENPVFLFIAFMACGFSFSGGPICSASYVKSVFGPKNYPQNIGFANLNVIIASIIGPYLSALIYQSGGYMAVFPAIVAFGSISLIFCLLLARAAEKFLARHRS